MITQKIGFKEMNEFSYAKQVAKKYNTIHHEILMKKKDYVNGWEKLIQYKDSPLGVPNEIPLAAMSTKLKEKITVVLSGEGADELMGGYGRIFRSPLDYANQNIYKSFYDFFISQYEYVPRSFRDKLISSPSNYRMKFDTELKEDFLEFSGEQSIFHFFHRYHVQGLLQRVDITTMQTSVEARVPFLDHELIEYVYTKIPIDLKLKWNDEQSKKRACAMQAKEYSEILDTPKYLIRKLSYKYLPKNIVERKKVGFPVPLTEWFGDLELLAYELLNDCSWLNKNAVDILIKKSKEEIRAGQILWMFINVEIFKNLYFKKSWRW
jgi:asparagine synthase (glutamine-hydrolysing)